MLLLSMSAKDKISINDQLSITIIRGNGLIEDVPMKPKITDEYLRHLLEKFKSD